ncbi:MAG TPA: glycosyltransferase family 39 protein [Solirubrobacteraceae bacterium]|nr:glycosyltransferase family 39 protein [Solirubrobacteraceae bacterium]
MSDVDETVRAEPEAPAGADVPRRDGRAAGPVAPAPPAPPARRRARLTGAGAALVAVLVAGEAVRLWSVGHGLPAVHNVDEGAHFVRSAVKFFRGDYNPHYFLNPPAFSYLLHGIFAFSYGGIWPFGAGDEVIKAFRRDPSDVYLIGRIVAGLLGVVAAGILYAVGKRLYGAAAGLVAAALMSFSFLPVFYGHLALNDIPTLVPLTLGLLGAVRIYQRGESADYALAGAGLGFATAFKYTAAALLLPIALAWGLRVWEDRGRFKPELLRLVLAGVLAGVAFCIANPYALLEPRSFAYGVREQRTYAGEVQKIGLDEVSGWAYYIWTLTWGYGWIPLGLSAIGTLFALRRDWRTTLLLLSFVVVFWLFMGQQTRFYGRWLLPVYPFLALLAGYGVVRLARLAPRRWRTAAAIAIAAAALVQPVASVVHVNRVLGRTDTRELARDWLDANLPRGQRPVIESIASTGFGRVREHRKARLLWPRFRMPPGRSEDAALKLRPRLIDQYANQGFCVVVVGSIQRDRAFKDPNLAPAAIRYYERLGSEARLVASFSPTKPGRPLPEFNFDWSYDYYPRDYERPGPQVDIYRLQNGLCATQAVLRGEPGRRGTLPPLPPPRLATTVAFLNPVRSLQRGECTGTSWRCPGPWPEMLGTRR